MENSHYGIRLICSRLGRDTLHLDCTIISCVKCSLLHCRYTAKSLCYNCTNRYARFRLECPMPIMLCAPSREYTSCFAFRLGLCPHSGVEHVKVGSPATLGRCTAQLASLCSRPSDHPKSGPVYGKLFMIKNSNKMLIFFPTITPIDKRPSPSVTHHQHVSARKISPPYVVPFQRR